MTKENIHHDTAELKLRHNPFEIILCRGFAACPRALADPLEDGAPLAVIEERLSTLPIHAGPSKIEIRPFSISISLCPNGCSRPQIADIGIIAVTYPCINYSRCTGCAVCIPSCRESALKINSEGRPDVHHTCIGCGDCFASCPSGALESGEKGFRILLGGKLGRHPHLAEDTGIIYNTGQVLDQTLKWYTFWFRNHIPGERFRGLTNRRGL